MLRRPALLCAALLLTSAAGAAPPLEAQSGKAVLVTGASSGIGRKITELLAAQGHFVYAGARKQADLDELSAIPNVQGVRLDVTVDADLAAAVETVRRGGRGLHGLVNNAGIGVVGPLIEYDEGDLRYLFDVNVFGPFRVTKAFAPLLIESKGRVSIISSISGILSGPLFGPYSMSKHAIEAYGDALAVELDRFGVRVSLVEPGNYRSDIGRNLLDRLGSVDSVVAGSRYATELRNMLSGMESYERAVEPDAVAEAVAHALFDPAPRMRYMVVPVARQAEVTIRKAMEELVQLNHGHRFSHDREALVRMLDEALARVAAPR
jgi:NAD(P)-dependent dehydrogenase (short-subunit alcohol dehydrogenase family)